MFQFDVDYYNKEEEKLLQNTIFAKELNSLTNTGLNVDPLDLLAESMFMEQKSQTSWTNREELINRAVGRIDEFCEYFRLNSRTLVANFSAQDMENHRIERAGVGASLYAMGKMLGTNAADWEKINIGSQKDLDFQVASTEENFLVVECKASINKNVTRKTPSISQHKSHIKAKKQKQRAQRSSDTLIGTITVIPYDDNTPAKILLVDPPLPRPFTSPNRFKVIARYRSYERLIHLIGKPFLLVALNTRIKALENIEDIASLSGLPLVNMNGEPFSIPTSFLNNRSGTRDGSIVGIVQLRRERLIFLGIDTSVIHTIVGQSHEEIINWTSSMAGRQEMEIIVRPKDLEEERVETARSNWDIINFDITVNSSGLVLGIASL